MRREAAKMYVWTQVILFLMLAAHHAAGPRRGRAMAGPARRQHRQGARLRHAARSLPAARAAGTGRERHPRVDHVDGQLQHELRRAGVPERRLQAIARPAGVGSPLPDGRPDRRREPSSCSRWSSRPSRENVIDIAVFMLGLAVGRTDGQLGAMVVVALQRQGAIRGVVRRTAAVPLQSARGVPLLRRRRAGVRVSGGVHVDGGDNRAVGRRRALHRTGAGRETRRVLPPRAADGRLGTDRRGKQDWNQWDGARSSAAWASPRPAR